MNKARANELLRYGIKILKGEAFNARRNIRLQNVFELKRQLDEAGFWWQRDILGFWINRFTSLEGSTPRIGEGSS